MPNKLSPRQTEIAYLVASGLQDKQIAEELGISEETVAQHLRRAFKKLEINSRTQLATHIVRDMLASHARATPVPAMN